MIEDVFVINPVTHAYDLRDVNVKSSYGGAVRDLLVAFHGYWNPPEYQVSPDVYLSDWPAEVLVRTLFLESDVDLAAHHNLRLDSYFHDGLCSHEKNVELAERWPNRMLTYVGVDPTDDVEVCIRDLEAQMQELPGSVGLKLYPGQVEPFRSFRMDDPKKAYPLFERAQDLGIKTVAIHKTVPLGPVPMDPYRVDDIDGAAIQFPGLNFEIVHAGMAFAEETAMALARFPNVYANLEVTSLLLHKAPGLFNEVMGLFLFWGGPGKVIYSDGCMFCHSQLVLEKFWDWKLPESLLEKYGIEQVTRHDKAAMLGGNFARIAGIDLDAVKETIADDEFAKMRASEGRQMPYSNWRAIFGKEA